MANFYTMEVVHENVTIVTSSTSNGFAWYDEGGNRHMEDGFQLPRLTIHYGTVQELIGEDGERSVGWYERKIH